MVKEYEELLERLTTNGSILDKLKNKCFQCVKIN